MMSCISFSFRQRPPLPASLPTFGFFVVGLVGGYFHLLTSSLTCYNLTALNQPLWGQKRGGGEGRGGEGRMGSLLQLLPFLHNPLPMNDDSLGFL